MGLTGSAHDAHVDAHTYDHATALAAAELWDGSISGDGRDSLSHLLGDVLAYHAGIAVALDEFEGVLPGRPDESLYRRAYAPLLAPKDDHAWLYFYNQPLPYADTRRSEISSGSWRAHIANRPRD